MNMSDIRRRLRQVSPTTWAIVGASALTLGLLWALRRPKTSNVMPANSYFTIPELCASSIARQRGIDNTPPASVVGALQTLITRMLNPIRQIYGEPIIVSSGYRCPELNRAVGGVTNSQHLKGEAADLQGQGKTKAELIRMCRAALTVGGYDQLIFESVGDSLWLHVSCKSSGNRGEFLLYKGGSYSKLSTTNWESKI